MDTFHDFCIKYDDLVTKQKYDIMWKVMLLCYSWYSVCADYAIYNCGGLFYLSYYMKQFWPCVVNNEDSFSLIAAANIFLSPNSLSAQQIRIFKHICSLSQAIVRSAQITIFHLFTLVYITKTLGSCAKQILLAGVFRNIVRSLYVCCSRQCFSSTQGAQTFCTTAAKIGGR